MKRLDKINNFPDVMRPLGYEINDADRITDGPFDMLYQMAQKIDAMSKRIDQLEQAEKYRNTGLRPRDNITDVGFDRDGTPLIKHNPPESDFDFDEEEETHP